MAPAGQKYKIKLASGRILGPIGLDRVRLLILKNQITGDEIAREYPTGDWLPIGNIVAIADLLVARAEGKLSAVGPEEPSSDGETRPYIPIGTTRVITPGEAPPRGSRARSAPSVPPKPTRSRSLEISDDSAEDSTVVVSRTELAREGDEETDQASFASQETVVLDPGAEGDQVSVPSINQGLDWHSGTRALEQATRAMADGDPAISDQSTLMLSGENGPWNLREILRDPRKLKTALRSSKNSLRKSASKVAVVLAIIYILLEILNPGGHDNSLPPLREEVPIRAMLPAYTQGTVDPRKSTQLYQQGVKLYVLDNVAGYKAAAARFRESAQADISNVKALALLASSYLNLIDSANKDENYFNVISKLIALSLSKGVDLPESVIADVEFDLVINEPEAARTRIVDYTKAHATFGPEMYYYLAEALLQEGNYQDAYSAISQYPEAQFFSAKVYYLRGRIAEKLEDDESAIVQYGKAIQLNPDHARSRLALANLLQRKNRLPEAATHLEYLVRHPTLLAPLDLARAYFLHALWSEAEKDFETAMGDMERAVVLDRENHDYLLELYELKANTGGNIRMLKPYARMYYFLGEGEKLLRAGNTQEALTQFLQARQANDKSPLPLVKIGDMFFRMHDLLNARANYKMAAERAKDNIYVWSKYIDVLIQTYEWDEARRAMDRFRQLPVPQSAIDKAAADMYARQAMYVEAQYYYRKAMSRDVIDPSVYIAYAKNLVALKSMAEAPFFFALARRIDPLDADAVVGAARCLAVTGGLDKAIDRLEEELRKGTDLRAELLSALAEFEIEKGSWAKAQDYVDQAMKANPEFAYPWKLEAEIYLGQEAIPSRAAIDKALQAYASYSDRNSSDPSGYLERYRLFVKIGEFEKASDELGKIFAIYPKYPNLHFYKGALYSIMGNHKAAIEEFKSELTNNPNSIATLLSYGREYIQLGQVGNATALFNKAMQLAPRSAEAKLEAGYANYLLKNYSGAVALYQAALALDQGNPLIYKRMGMAYRDMDEGDKAAQAFREYLKMEPDAADKAEIEQYLQ